MQNAPGIDAATETPPRRRHPRQLRAAGAYCLDAASATGDQSKRAQLMDQAEQVLPREMPVLPIYFGATKNLVSARVEGGEDNLFNITCVKDLSLEK